MALTQDDFVGAVAKINDLTRRQMIKWKPCTPPNRTSAGQGLFAFSAVSTAASLDATASFEALHDGRVLRITEYEGAGGLLSLGDRVHKYALDVRDQHGNAVFEFPDVAGISDLFKSIQTQELDIEGFIKKLVSG